MTIYPKTYPVWRIPQGEAIEVSTGNFVYPDPLYHLKLDYSSESLYATHPTLAIEPGEYVLVPTRYGKDLALVMGKVRVPIGIRPDDVVTIERQGRRSGSRAGRGFP